MKTCGYCGRENEDKAPHCHECGTEFPGFEPVGQPVKLTLPQPSVPMTNREFALGIVCWLTSVAGAWYGLFGSVILVATQVGSGHKPSMSFGLFTLFVFPLVTIFLAASSLRSGSARGRVRGLRWLFVPPLGVSVVTVLLVSLAWLEP